MTFLAAKSLIIKTKYKKTKKQLQNGGAGSNVNTEGQRWELTISPLIEDRVSDNFNF